MCGVLRRLTPRTSPDGRVFAVYFYHNTLATVRVVRYTMSPSRSPPCVCARPRQEPKRSENTARRRKKHTRRLAGRETRDANKCVHKYVTRSTRTGQANALTFVDNSMDHPLWMASVYMCVARRKCRAKKEASGVVAARSRSERRASFARGSASPSRVNGRNARMSNRPRESRGGWRCGAMRCSFVRASAKSARLRALENRGTSAIYWYGSGRSARVTAPASTRFH